MSSNINRQPIILEELIPSNKTNTFPLVSESNENKHLSRGQLITENMTTSIKMSSIRINKIKDRIFILSPKVKSGEDRESNMEDFYLLDEPIKYGCLGNLIPSIHKHSKVKYALKIIKKEEMINFDYAEKINTFIDNNYRFTNQNLIKFINHFEEENHLVFIYSYMKLNLLDFIEKHFSNDDFYENLSMQYFIQIVGVVLFFNNNKKYNLNIRPENIMIDKQNTIKITDIKNKDIINSLFNDKKDEKSYIYNSSPIPNDLPTIIIDYYTTQEELEAFYKQDVFEINNLEKTDKQDVWRLGALLFHLVSGKAPYQNYDSLGILSNKSISSQLKKACLLKDFFLEKELKIEISDYLIISESESEKRLSSELQGRSASINIFIKEYNKKIESLVRLFMEKSLNNRPTMKELKENQILKSLLSKYKTPRSSLEIKDTQKYNQLKNAKSANGSESPLEILKQNYSADVLRKKNTYLNISSDSGEFENLPFETKICILQEENKNLKKELENFKLDNFRLENENKILLNDVNNIQNSYDKDRKTNEEEKKRMNTLNQDRISKINELEEMTNEIIELKSKLRLLENECDMMQFDLNEANETINDLQKKIDDMNNNFAEEKSQYIIKIENLENNSKKLEKYCFGANGEMNNFFKDDESIKRFSVALFDMVKEFKEVLDKFIINNFTDKAEILYNINYMLNEKEEMIKNYIHTIKNDFMDEYLRLSMKPINGYRPDKTKERFEWIQKQVVELTPFKIKSINLETQNSKLISENKINSEVIYLKNIEIDLLKKLNDGLKDKIKEHADYISCLESKLGYIKDFVFTNLPQCLEELKL